MRIRKFIYFLLLFKHKNFALFLNVSFFSGFRFGFPEISFIIFHLVKEDTSKSSLNDIKVEIACVTVFHFRVTINRDELS